jgi:CRP-like cAMP-binding protein
MDVAGLLLKNPIFADLSRRDVEELVLHARRVTFERGQEIWSEGTPATSLYVIGEGQVKSYRVSREGAELILEIASAGDCLGEVGLFHPGGVRLVRVAAMERTVCVEIGRAPLVEFMSRHPPAMLRMFEALSETAGRAAYSLIDVAFEDIRGRVARTLLALVREQGERTGAGERIRLKLSQATLAAMVAATRENVNRALGFLIANGAVSQREGYFFVHDRRLLESAAEAEEAS